MLNQSLSATESNIVLPQRWLLIFILILMSTSGLVGSDVYLPTLPSIGLALNKNITAMQFTLGVYLFGLSIGQLLLGPLTDRYGRKNLIILGMLVYFFASVACAVTHVYWQMIIARICQAFGASSGLVVGRAIIGDLFDKKEAGKIFATIFPFVGMSPAMSPVIGGMLGYYFGWQSTFIFISIFSLMVALLTLKFIPETLADEKKQKLDLITIISAYPKLLKNKKFLAYLLAPCVAYIAYFAYIAQSPFILHANRYGERAIGMFYITLSLTYVAGNLLAKRLLNTHRLDQIILWGYLIFNLGGFLLIFSGMASSLIMMIFSISLLTFGNGFLIPLGTAGVISFNTHSIGYASGLLGFLQLGSAAVSSAIIGTISQNSITRMGIYIFIFTLLGFALFLYCNKEQ